MEKISISLTELRNINTNLVVYTIIWVLCLAMYGHYSKMSNAKSLLRGVTIGSVLILVIYGLLPLEYRSSRMVLLMGAGATLLICWLTTLLWNRSVRNKWTLNRNPKLNVLIAASTINAQNIKEITTNFNSNLQLIGNVSIAEDATGKSLGIWSSVLILLLFPMILVLNRLRWKSIVHAWQVLIGKMTWVSYIPNKGTFENMPTIKPAVLALDSNIKLPLTTEQQRITNQEYARYYEVWDDQVLLIRNLNRLHIRY